jgi:hypothetical protein
VICVGIWEASPIIVQVPSLCMRRASTVCGWCASAGYGRVNSAVTERLRFRFMLGRGLRDGEGGADVSEAAGDEQLTGAG